MLIWHVVSQWILSRTSLQEWSEQEVQAGVEGQTFLLGSLRSRLAISATIKELRYLGAPVTGHCTSLYQFHLAVSASRHQRTFKVQNVHDHQNLKSVLFKFISVHVQALKIKQNIQMFSGSPPRHIFHGCLQVDVLLLLMEFRYSDMFLDFFKSFRR